MGIKPVPKEVRWLENDGKTEFRGMVIREIQEIENYPHGDFCKVIQVIRENGEAEEVIRCGYYTKKHGAPDKDYMWSSRKAFVVGRNSFERMIRQL